MQRSPMLRLLLFANVNEPFQTSMISNARGIVWVESNVIPQVSASRLRTIYASVYLNFSFLSPLMYSYAFITAFLS